MRRVINVLVLLAAVAATAHAQLRGTVRDSAAGAPLPGAIVSLLDSAGRSQARAISDAAGAFSIVALPSAARVRVVRIGYHPIEMAAPAAGASLNIMMGHLPPMLDVVRVVGRELCPGSAERGAAFELWEQARAGLLATVVARDVRPAMVHVLRYETHLSPDDHVVQFQSKKVTSGQTTRPFVASAPPSFFARAGYMIEANGTRVFNAPDADVLIDESFAATHCFRLRQPDELHAGEIGLSFSPVRGRDTTVDVDGVIWLDAATPQLRSLDFAYTSLEPAATKVGAGGHIEFRMMPNGVSFISWWYMRLALLRPSASRGSGRRATPAGPPRRTDMTDLHLEEIVDTGGELLDASWPDGAVWRDTLAILSGVIATKGTGAPVANARVAIVGTPDTVRADSAGRFRISTLPGRYVIEGADTALANFLPPRRQSTAVELRRGNEATVRIEVPPLQRVLADFCRDQAKGSDGLIVGSISFAGGSPRGALLTARFQEITSGSVEQKSEQVTLDDSGRFVLCRLPRDRGIRLTVTTSNKLTRDTTVAVPLDGLGKQVVWRIKP